jgi:hypothetical protein
MNAKNAHPNFKLIVLNVYAMASIGLIKLMGISNHPDEEETWCEMMVFTVLSSTVLFGCLPTLFYKLEQLLLLEKIIFSGNIIFLTIGLLFYRLSK